MEPRCLEVDPALVPVPGNPLQQAACVRVGEQERMVVDPSRSIMS
jgi:hypothetical protein